MEPYYTDGQVTLFLGDCLEITDWLHADMLVTDPPFGISYESGAQRVVLPNSIVGDESTAARDNVLEMWADRAALVFGTWRVQRPTGTRALLVWDTKGALGMGDLSIPWKPSHQEIYVLGKGFHGRRDSDVICCAPVQSMAANGRVHPHEKPVTLLERLIDKCPPGIVADPFAGSGSTLVAARNLGRRAIGVEIEERYCEIIAKRLDQMCLDFGSGA
ncbi:DNA methyltransferase [Mycobacterium gordonae]|nr:DNA methyltransferase [Mycobacterium gordonae]OBK49413.1 DNA methyltransferase [Mycobacterium gordonae]